LQDADRVRRVGGAKGGGVVVVLHMDEAWRARAREQLARAVEHGGLVILDVNL